MKVDYDLEMPKLRAEYPFKEMKVGGSVLFKSDEYDAKTVRVRASQMKKEIGATFTCRKVEGGLRVWRIA